MNELAISLEEKTLIEELLEEIVSLAIEMGVEIKAKKEKVKRICKEKNEKNYYGHNLLKKNEKVLVLGATTIDQDTMNELTRLYGFKKNDFRYETDYTKIVSFASRISDNYVAIIFGACPHKVSKLGGWSGIISKYINSDNSPAIYDARSHAGQLKVTKESFNAAILSMCSDLLKRAC